MSASILTGAFAGQRLKADPDQIWEAEGLPNTTSKTSGVFKFGKAQAGVELSIVAASAISIADTQSLTIEIEYDVSETGSFADSYKIYDETASGAAITFTAGDVIALSTPETDVEQWARIKVTTTADESSETIDAELHRVV